MVYININICIFLPLLFMVNNSVGTALYHNDYAYGNKGVSVDLFDLSHFGIHRCTYSCKRFKSMTVMTSDGLLISSRLFFLVIMASAYLGILVNINIKYKEPYNHTK